MRGAAQLCVCGGVGGDGCVRVGWRGREGLVVGVVYMKKV